MDKMFIKILLILAIILVGIPVIWNFVSPWLAIATGVGVLYYIINQIKKNPPTGFA